MVQNYSKSVLITGSSGLLGGTLCQYLSKYYNIYNTAREAVNNTFIPLDITNKEMVKNVISYLSPDYIINCAAMTNVDKCEIDRSIAYDVNVAGLKNIIDSSPRSLKIVHISSDYVFDGSKKIYLENDLPNPVNYYGKTKLLSENLLRSSNRDYIIFRTSLLYDNSKNNFYTWVKNNVIKNNEISVINDQTSNPTWVWSLAESIYKSLINNLSGIFHYSGYESINRFNFAEKISNSINSSYCKINSIPTSELNQIAKRPMFSILSTKKIKEHIDIEHPNLDYVLELIMDKNNK